MLIFFATERANYSLMNVFKATVINEIVAISVFHNRGVSCNGSVLHRPVA